ncbi:MAG: hypothetical protein ACRD5H_05125, partial [Nitrososphaerales archaeon]
VYDSVNNLVKGYHRTELDYNTAEYYSPYVCGSLLANGVEQVRSCYGGIISATRNTQITGSPNTAEAISNHYVDIYFYDEGTLSYIDYYGYGFLPGNMYPISYFFYAPNIYSNRTFDSVHTGSTNAQAQKPTVTIEGYTFRAGEELTSAEKYTIKKELGDIYLHITISATPSATFDGTETQVTLTKTTATPGGIFAYVPASQVATKDLVKGDSVDVTFKISTDQMNTYLGPITYRVNISDVIKKAAPPAIPMPVSIAANVTINPSAGLNTNVTMPTNKILNVTVDGN